MNLIRGDARRDRRRVCSQAGKVQDNVSYSQNLSFILSLHPKTAPFAIRNNDVMRKADAEGLVEREGDGIEESVEFSPKLFVMMGVHVRRARSLRT